MRVCSLHLILATIRLKSKAVLVSWSVSNKSTFFFSFPFSHFSIFPSSISSISPNYPLLLLNPGQATSPPLSLSLLLSHDVLSPGNSLPRNMLGSFEESLLTGRVASFGVSSAVVEGFYAALSANGSGCFCKKRMLPLSTAFSHTPGCPSPYVGVVDLDEGLADTDGLYAIPRKGCVQVTIFNPTKTGVKFFGVLYDFSDMPPRTHTFLRRRETVKKSGASSRESPHSSLRYAIHLRFRCSEQGELALHKEIRVVFSSRTPDDSERLEVLTQGPESPVYCPWPSTVHKRSPHILGRSSGVRSPDVVSGGGFCIFSEDLSATHDLSQ